MRLHPAPDATNMDYKRYSAIIKKLSETPGMYEKETGWTPESQVEFKRLVAEGYGLGEVPADEFINGAGI